MFYGFSTDPVDDAARYYEALDAESRAYESALQCEIEMLEEETIKQVKSGDYERLWRSLEYRDNAKMVFEALIACAEKGDEAAKAAIACLVHTYAENYAEVP